MSKENKEETVLMVKEEVADMRERLDDWEKGTGGRNDRRGRTDQYVKLVADKHRGEVNVLFS